MFSVLPVGNEVAPALVADPRLPVISFTGSESVGFAIKRDVPTKHVILELGGNAAAIVLADYSSPKDLEWAVQRIAMFGNSQAGQTCVSVQRVFVADEIADEFTSLLVTEIANLPSGSPWDPATVVGPMIHEPAAIRVEEWISEAVEAGATVLAGGKGGVQGREMQIRSASRPANRLAMPGTEFCSWMPMGIRSRRAASSTGPVT